ncbi:hypothetical protein CAPTEDRAFT_164776 [Capitella teleta]|uniref:RRM domain-containing protein n=1 Tax=Capitella teleta TaxID=283909 RepID=R7UKU3_CAPTE|nr:hypothetical protein CAPTEDRAFT_164776 [Capitella teleta]|eukprot:ELU06855.1 hypothetical protein CAPTEDRAFT_164776 [Capitella teleta]
MSEMYANAPEGHRVFVGELGSRAGKYELEKEFEYFGPIVDVWVARNPPGFAFVVYKHSADAKKAVKELDGRMICGRRVRVELARPYEPRRDRGGRGGGDRGDRGRFGRGGRRPYAGRSRDYDRRDSRDHGSSRRRSRTRTPSPYRRDRRRSMSRSRSPDDRRSFSRSPSIHKSPVKRKFSESSNRSRSRSLDRRSE